MSAPAPTARPAPSEALSDVGMLVSTTGDPAADRRLAEVVRLLVDGLTGVQAAGAACGLDRCRVAVVCVAVAGGAIAPGLAEQVARLAPGTMVFLVAVGAWPAEVGTADRVLRPVLARLGAWCPAPTLHLDVPAPRAIADYARYWRPVAGGVLRA
ncbi:hypothetical protein [Pseudonocardia xishanensis]|uniref:Uncharacterized protein n=1 Tax=Pseudonocardia xishanensis TaxID=630995 RepID=A0ABP8REG2_9PSEU